ncbi:Nephrin-like protein [Leptotrombidium deliense]|uniref:Nephrin-like protein n=1 Tax=Leptotrombidium deliense TaxID=299467 RepID=A0A443SWU9_9ACAR|nr:Nephrin-like protein [Leptotrombidium deliense]
MNRFSKEYEGNDVYFECQIRASPHVTEVRWWFEGKEIHTNTSAGVIVSNQSLVLQRVTRFHRGRYTCRSVIGFACTAQVCREFIATNKEGEGESNSVHLRVQYTPVCKASQKILYGAARLEAVKVYCEVEADPTEVTFQWSFNNSNENVEITNHVSDGTMSTATYIPKTEFDYGTLFCWGRNNVGKQIEPCVFSVIPAGPPDPVKNCTVINQTEESIRIDCSEGYDGGLHQRFVMEVNDISRHKVRSNITNGRPTFIARSLPSGTSFVVVIYAFNAKGKSKSVALTAATLALPESMTRMGGGNVWQLTFSPVFGLLILIVVVVVIIAFIIVIVWKLKPNSHRIRKAKGTIKEAIC